MIQQTSSKKERDDQRARRRIRAFERRFGRAHLLFAQHAAFPLSLTAELLYHLRNRFTTDRLGHALHIPVEAVSDLMLSSLCQEVAYELFEMPSVVRQLLLDDLRQDPLFGTQRLTEISSFLLEYIGQLTRSSRDEDTREFAAVQRWVALAYFDPERSAHAIALRLARLHATGTQGEQIGESIRLAAIVEDLADPLKEAGFQPLILYARSMGAWEAGRADDAMKLYGDALSVSGIAGEAPSVSGKAQLVNVAGIELPIPVFIHARGSGEPRVVRRILTPSLNIFLGSLPTQAALELQHHLLAHDDADRKQTAMVFIDTNEAAYDLREFRNTHSDMFTEYDERISIPPGLEFAARLDHPLHTFVPHLVPQGRVNIGFALRNAGHVAMAFNFSRVLQAIEAAFQGIERNASAFHDDPIAHVQCTIVVDLGSGMGGGIVNDIALICPAGGARSWRRVLRHHHWHLPRSDQRPAGGCGMAAEQCHRDAAGNGGARGHREITRQRLSALYSVPRVSSR